MKNVIRFPTQLRATRSDATYDRQFRVIHGYRRAYIKAGSGPVLLLIHGSGDSADRWLDVLPDLAKDHTVIAPDLLGHGESDQPRADYSIAGSANAMRDLLAVLDVERATVVGHSLGGGVAMQFAYQFPERCERICLVSTGGVAHEVTPLLRFASLPNADLVLPLIGTPGSRMLGRLTLGSLKALNTNLGLDADHLMRVFDALPDAPARRAFVRTLRAAIDWKGQAITMLDRCYLTQGMPTLVIWGARDAVIPVAHAHKAHAAMPGSQLEVFPDVGHFPHQDEPQRFLRLFREFYRGTEANTYAAEDWRAVLRRGAIVAPVAERRLEALSPLRSV